MSFEAVMACVSIATLWSAGAKTAKLYTRKGQCIYRAGHADGLPKLLHNCLHDGVFEVAVHLAVGIIRLDHHHADEFLFRVDPEVGSVGSVPAEAALGN